MSDECWTESIKQRTRKLDLPTAGAKVAAALNAIAHERRTPDSIDQVTVSVKDGSLYLVYEIDREIIHDDGDLHS